MSIRQQIIGGYALVLGVAFFGTVGGLLVANHYQQQAVLKQFHASEQRKLLYKIQSDFILNHPAPQLLRDIKNEEDFTQDINDILTNLDFIETKIKDYTRSIQQIDEVSMPRLLPLLAQYLEAIEDFKKRLTVFSETASSLLDSPENLPFLQQEIVKLIQSPEFIKFIELSNQINSLESVAEQAEKQAVLELKKANKLNNLSTISVFLSSFLVAIALGIYKSRKITEKIEQFTGIAEQIYETSDFSLRFWVWADQKYEELDVLAKTFNRLLRQVVFLLEEKEKYTNELKKDQRQLEWKNKKKIEFLANMSHELKTPLNGILGHTQILAKTPLDEQQKQSLDVIHQCGSHLLFLVNDFLEFVKIEGHTKKLNFTDCDLHGLLEGVLEVTRLKTNEKGLELLDEQDSQLPKVIIADEKSLRQVLINLLDNATKFTDEGQVILQVRLKENLELSPDWVEIHFRIIDTGRGMNSDQLKSIFLPFEQVGTPEKNNEGLGLGLAITHELVEMMGGEIVVTSERGVGSIFEFSLQCAIAPNPEKLNLLEQTASIVGYEGERRTILVVDNHWEHRSVMVKLLQPLGFKVLESSHGQEALQIIQQQSLEGVIIDLKMPVMDGWELLDQLQQLEGIEDKAVIISSANLLETEQQKVVELGCDFLPKPIQAELLYQLLAKNLHLQWAYSENSLSSSEDLACEMVLPPLTVLQQLLEQAQQGQINTIQTELDALSQNHCYNAFINDLKPLVQAFDILKVREFLQNAIANYLTQSS